MIHMGHESNDSQKLKHISKQVTDVIQLVLKSNLVGIYLTGSAVLSDWHYGKSDLDLTVVVNRSLSKKDVAFMEEQIKKLESQYPNVKYEIQYVPILALGKSPEEIEPMLSYHDRKHSLSYFGFNAVTWFTLKKHGVALYGKPVEELHLKTDEDELCAYVYNNVNTYWTAWAASAAKIFSIKGILSFTDWAVEWCVCGISRMYYTLQEKDITSKNGSLEYMLNKAPKEYQKILKEAQTIRMGQGHRLYSSRSDRRKDIIKYMNYMVGLCLH